MQRTPNDFPTMNLPAPDVPMTSKEWQKSVTKDLRNHVVGKLIKAIFPSPDPTALLDQRIKDLITYAKQVEKEVFEMANDRDDYYHLLTVKIYEIQRELHEKKNSRVRQARDPPTVSYNDDGTVTVHHPLPPGAGMVTSTISVPIEEKALNDNSEDNNPSMSNPFVSREEHK